jgi:hypothetical protein
MVNPTVGGQQTFVSGVNGVVVFNGLTYLASRSFKADWGNKLEQEKVGGTDIPIVNTAEFDGKGELIVIYSTENTSVSTTTSGTSNSGQAVLTTAATTGFVAGQVVTINNGKTDAEECTILSVQAGTSLTMTTNLVNTHVTAEPVAVNSEQLSNLVKPVNGQIPAVNLSWTGKDVNANSRVFTWTGTVWPQNVSLEQSGPSVIAHKITFIFSARPTLT